MPYIGTSPSNGVRRVFTYTATASQTTFSGASNEGSTLAYVDNNYLDVFQNGILLGSADYTSTNGTSVVLAQAASVDDIIVIVAYDVFSVADTVSKTDGGTFDSAVTMANNLTVSGAFTSQGIDDNADATAITIDSSENVGIGETSPNGKLNLATGSGTACELRLTSNNTGSGAGDRGRFVVYSAKNDGTAYEAGKIEIDRSSGTATEAHMVFATNTGSGNTEHMRINKDGAVLVNSTARNDLGNLEVLTTIGVDNAMIIKTPESGASGSATAIKFRYNGGTSGTITFGSTNTAYSTTSDYRLKENVDYTFDATTRLKQLRPCRFNFIADADTTVDGFLAHEVSSVVPEAISGDKDGTDDNGNIVPQGIDQSKLVPLLVKTIQELEARITVLEKAE